MFNPERELTEREKELLIILMEEAAEVIQTASKCLRFGYGNTNPYTGVKNYKEIGLEIGDFLCVMQECEKAKLIFTPDMYEGEKRKRERLAKYLRSTNDAITKD